jgi:hypothetical protein
VYSPLELVLPSGAAESIRVLGSGCPDDLVPIARIAGPNGDADLVVVAPHARDGRTASSADRLAREALLRLRPGGVAIVIGTSRIRRALERRLSAAGLVPRLTFAHTRIGAATGLASFEGGALEHADGHAPAVRARVSSTPLFGPRASRLGAGSLVLANGEIELAAWLRPSGTPPLEGLYLRPSWRGRHGTVTATGIAGGRPVVVGKLGLGTRSAGVGGIEGDALRRLGPSARAAGAVVPELLGLVDVGDRAASLLSPIPGRPLAERIRGRTRALAAAERVAAWLGAWCSTTYAKGSAASALAAEIEAPLTELESELGLAFLDDVRRLASAIRDDESSLCARHGDLTLWNILVGRGRIGVVDWESALENALPLSDLPYLLVDAVSAGDRYRARTRAFAACFLPGGDCASWASDLMARTATTAGVAQHELELATHACWLRHAADERRRGLADGPFLRILRLHAESYR